MEEVQKLGGKPVVFADINLNPNLAFGSVVEGYHDDAGPAVRVWLDPHLPYEAQEAVAAHELAHVMQHLKHFPTAKSAGEKTDKRLKSALYNLVLDDHADRWAIGRGFRIDAALKNGKLGEFQAALDAMPPAANREGDADEILRMGLNYAALKVRLERFDLFKNMDESWARQWPTSRAIGLQLAEIVTRHPVNDAAASRRILAELAQKLGTHIPVRQDVRLSTSDR